MASTSHIQPFFLGPRSSIYLPKSKTNKIIDTINSFLIISFRPGLQLPYATLKMSSSSESVSWFLYILSAYFIFEYDDSQKYVDANNVSKIWAQFCTVWY